jgi:hypothetical protein
VEEHPSGDDELEGRKAAKAGLYCGESLVFRLEFGVGFVVRCEGGNVGEVREESGPMQIPDINETL